MMFISFPLDMAAGNWSVQQVVDLVNTYKNSGAQMKVDGKPFVSTFEGLAGPTTGMPYAGRPAASSWCHWTRSSLGAYGVGGKLGIVDGACELAFLRQGHVERIETRVSRYLNCSSSLLGCMATGRPAEG